MNCKHCGVELNPNNSFINHIRKGNIQYFRECKDCRRVKINKFGFKRCLDYRMRNPQKIKAQLQIRVAVRLGKVDKPESCSVCKKALTKKQIQAHHEDYSQPLDVIWVCDMCHKKIHKEKRKSIVGPKYTQ